MTVEKFADLAGCQLTANVTTTPTPGTPETWNVGSLQNLPTLASGDQWRGVVLPSGGDSDPEIVIVTASTSSTLTVKRGEGSNATVKTHSSGDTISLIVASAQIVQMVTGTLASVNYSSGAATVTTPGGTVSASLPSNASTDPNMYVGNTCTMQIGPNGPLILSAGYTRPRPSGRMWLDFAFEVNNGTDTQVAAFTEDWLTGGVTLAGSPNIDSLVAPIAGKYRVSVGASMTVAGLGEAVAVNVTVDGSVVRAGGTAGSGGNIGSGTLDDLVQLGANDHVGLQVFQDSGSTRALIDNPTATFVSIEWESWV